MAATVCTIVYPLLLNDTSPEQDESLLLRLLDIFFAYAYDHLLTDGDPPTEPSWTLLCTF